MLSSNNSFFPYTLHLRVTVLETEHNFVVPFLSFIHVIILLSKSEHDIVLPVETVYATIVLICNIFASINIGVTLIPWFIDH